MMYSIGIDMQSRVKKMINEARYYSRYQIFLVVPLGQEPDPVNRYKLCLWLKAVALNFVITFTTPFCKKTNGFSNVKRYRPLKVFLPG